MPPRERPRLGISSCLLGNPVRYDGGHKHDAILTEQLGSLVEWVPVCPEVEAGMGTPREPVRLESVDGEVRMISQAGVDHTAAMREFTSTRVAALRELDLSGYVLKKDSPSCGKQRGLFAQALLEAFPQLPIEEEDRLHDPAVRQNFLARVFGYR